MPRFCFRSLLPFYFCFFRVYHVGATTAAFSLFSNEFYFVTTGWIFEIGLCDNSINQCLKCHPSRYTHISHTLTRRMMSQSLLYTSRSGLTSRNPPWTGKTVCPLGDIAGSVVYRKLAFASVSKEQNGWVGVRV